MDKVVVIGGSGFMGSHTADALSTHGYQVTIFDYQVSPWLRGDQQMVLGNILDQEAVTEAVRDARYVYHYAGLADIGEATRRPYDTINLNVMGTTIALEASVAANVERFVYASTMYVYSPYGSFYRASKQAAETVIEAYCEKFELNYTLLRYGSLYGPRAQEWNGLRGFVSQIVREGKLNYFGSGKERREYIHVLDAARLSIDILDDSHKDTAITVTGSQVLNSAELIAMIFEIAGCELNVNYHGDNSVGDHYTLTPYRYTPKKAKKLVPDEFLDVGEGILELVEEIHQDINSSDDDC
jgi:UDP-glucose 4-epimerase